MAYGVSSALILAASIGILQSPERKNMVYARIHMAGVIDVVCMFLTVILGYPLIGLIYFVVVPLTGHAIANAHYHRSTGGEVAG
ncbi:MAG: cation:proton antiporter [Candidatus Altiarchaeales archaeon]|nr:cation:proton antiporter [Candidatus Altiarchaeales archaeon]MBD3415893.1 cation:proton antiporter [Candidatus Altiarchaeales archaeon]